MTEKKDLKDFYLQRVSLFGEKYEFYRKKERNSNIFRGLSFLLGVVLAVVFANFSALLLTISILIFLILFLFFVKQNVEFQTKKVFYNNLKLVNENELKALDNDNSSFDSGQEFVDKGHCFSYDLDIFGDRSIFQKVNRTATLGGKKLLAEKFLKPSHDISQILEIQQNSALLEKETSLRHEFFACGKIFSGDVSNQNIENLSSPEYFFTKTPFYKIFSIALIIITLAAILLSSLDFVSPYFGLIMFLILQFVVIVNLNKTKTLNDKIEKNTKAFQKYSELFKVVEKMENVPQKFSKTISSKEVSKAFEMLQKISHNFEQRHNLMVAIFGQGIFLYDILVDMKFENWERKFSGKIKQWFEIIWEYDFLLSLANLKFNNPKWCFPTPKSEKYILNAKNAGHPLINDEKCVRNDINFSNCNYLIILTGANMAGKSTYLRTIGTNLILSQLGAVVCADSFEFSPVEVFTSIRTSDSVQDSQSYFFAELKRLEKIVKTLEQNTTLFIIVDEMLRGTNSKDKSEGSRKFLKKILQFSCYGIFATHDINIGEMKNEFPQNIDTKCFEISFKDEELLFDYKLKDGISKNLNASFLMKKLGITD